MNSKIKKIIIIISIAVLSLLAIFFLFEIAVSPATPDSPAISIKNIFSSDSKKNARNIERLPINEPKPLTLLFGGDVMLSRQVNDKMVKNKDYSWPFLKISDLLSSADLTIINLESPFAEAKDYSVPTGSFMFKANPEAISGLMKSGIDLVSLANNHILNQGAAGLSKTIEVIAQAGIRSIGAGKDEEAAHKSEIFTINDKSIGFLDYAYPDDNSVATDVRPGIAGMNLEKMAADVERLRSQADVVIVMMHAGTEYTYKPNEMQVAFAHKAIESGADLVIGHHPHWPQIWESYQGKPIIYSLGNLIFDQMWAKETSIGLIARLSWRDGWKEIEFLPIKISGYGQADFLSDGPEKEALFKSLNIPADGKIRLESQP